ncbi:potassium transporter [Sodiomyces alkalinus F11]|uniref:Potassium transporter n=1 Tax=Sodiomyces alkalinus (strain CBS 110278 / VKM F-3762 / F11) TaxID=1314773 RepID=A0A3N2PID8_SODAK|nr:potassium transporter [Sodiomyces alkalinus F11]ROT34443.1 potassium transporter [Sodiomyces alkalinus F11]
MRALSIPFITLHYTYIITCTIITFIILYCYGNLTAIDAFFLSLSGSTESGLNSIDIKLLKLYQQICLYFLPHITNLMFISPLTVAWRLFWFHKHMNSYDDAPARGPTSDDAPSLPTQSNEEGHNGDSSDEDAYPQPHPSPHITYPAELPKPRRRESPALYKITSSAFVLGSSSMHRRKSRTPTLAHDAADRVTLTQSRSGIVSLPRLSRSVTIGRNSNFFNLTEEDRETLGGVEYRGLKLLLKITSAVAYFVLGHVLGAICLIPWIHNAPSKYRDWLQESGQNETWWAIYSAQTMFNNLGFTLTPDSMMSFRDATWPMIIMTFLAFAGNTCYPVFLRLIIWITSKLVPRKSVTGETLRFLLDHPRRCYTLLFPSRPTWVLFGIVVLLNFIDVTLIITLDLDNAAVNTLRMGPRILAALFQAASARHTGTSAFNLANMNPAVQFSLLAMMYVAVFPIAISVRASNTYEEQSLGIYPDDEVPVDESNGRKYVLMHIRNQLSFDMWYIFLGTFIICAVESGRIMDPTDPSFSVFPIFFEVTSAYGNVGLSLGHSAVSTSLSGQFSLASKLVICALMIRGRHRWLPYALDRAVMLPTERARHGSDSQHPDDHNDNNDNDKDDDKRCVKISAPVLHEDENDASLDLPSL